MAYVDGTSTKLCTVSKFFDFDVVINFGGNKSIIFGKTEA